MTKHPVGSIWFLKKSVQGRKADGSPILIPVDTRVQITHDRKDLNSKEEVMVETFTQCTAKVSVKLLRRRPRFPLKH